MNTSHEQGVVYDLVIRDSEGRSPFGRAATRVSILDGSNVDHQSLRESPFLALTDRLENHAGFDLSASWRRPCVLRTTNIVVGDGYSRMVKL